MYFPVDSHILVKNVGANWAEMFDTERDKWIAMTVYFLAKVRDYRKVWLRNCILCKGRLLLWI